MRVVFCALTAVALMGCAGERGLRDLRSSTGGPDEFSVVPSAPLEIPETLALPTPTPGGSNRTDINPNANAVVALGGSPARAFAGGIPASDSALVARASRYGTQADIRPVLAAEDEAFRQRGRILNVFNVLGRDRYYQTYASQALNAYGELDRFRAAGVATPSAPPR
ncbi:Beta-barrel assembly machine subunit BamF [Cognatiyoonia sediminum]|uniref:Beta-barrel assembly machine subunit BamF n=1 Tax=Cognatiyoonia sediminum TaxID=1508389 RepID=A0A1M5RDJ9_9RHOB|nr:DUF3035 domain-containing protein [Cognatiyoonia sediminum]SHH24374.1 Beta-barrel assembly machine subunit BamF [Cognatiyoonia sediminum]